MSKDLDKFSSSIVTMSPRCKTATSNVSIKFAQDFYCSNPDKSFVDRAGFLPKTALPVTIRNLIADDVKIRVIGDFATMDGRTSYTTADGKQAYGRYTDCWARQNGKLARRLGACVRGESNCQPGGRK